MWDLLQQCQVIYKYGCKVLLNKLIIDSLKHYIIQPTDFLAQLCQKQEIILNEQVTESLSENRATALRLQRFNFFSNPSYSRKN